MKKLHIGCFDQVADGWINTDTTPQLFVARIPLAATILFRLGKLTPLRYQQHRKGLFRRVQYMDATKRFPFRDREIGHAFCSHMLEHLPKDKALPFAKEVYRVLKPGGIFRVAVPDLDLQIRLYDPANTEPFLKMMYEPGGRAANQHHWMYNETSLRALLLAAGFSAARRCAYREGRCPDAAILDNRPDESLYVEAVK